MNQKIMYTLLKYTIKHSLTLYIVSLLLVLPLFAQEKYRVFQNEEGKSLNAQVLEVTKTNVTLKLKNGRIIKTSPKFFSGEDRLYFKNWHLIKQAADGLLFEIDSNRKMEKKAREKAGTSDAIQLTTYEGYYKLKIENKTNQPIEGLRMEYRLYSSQENMAKKDRHDISTQQAAGTEFFNILPYETYETETNKITLIESKLDSGYRWKGGGDTSSSAKLEGIWLRIYLNSTDTLLYEYALPKSLAEKEDW